MPRDGPHLVPVVVVLLLLHCGVRRQEVDGVSEHAIAFIPPGQHASVVTFRGGFQVDIIVDPPPTPHKHTRNVGRVTCVGGPHIRTRVEQRLKRLRFIRQSR